MEKTVSHFICVRDGRRLQIMNSKSGHNWKSQRNENQIGIQNNIVHLYFCKSKGKMKMCMEGHPQGFAHSSRDQSKCNWKEEKRIKNKIHF